MLTSSSIILCAIFIILSGFHFYWLFGGTWGLDSVIPSKTNEATTLAIPKLATLIVALGLAFLAFFYLSISTLINYQFPDWISIYGGWFIASIFIIRAIGEFKYVGLFKKIKDTKFAKADTKIFVPLCLFIGSIGILIQFLK